MSDHVVTSVGAQAAARRLVGHHLAAVRASGLHIKDIATEDPDLEDVFLALTYHAEETPAA